LKWLGVIFDYMVFFSILVVIMLLFCYRVRGCMKKCLISLTEKLRAVIA